MKIGSRFGAVLDMVTDRCSTTTLLVYLGHLHPSLLLLFQFLISLDLASHYAHMVASLVGGSSSHKKVTSKTPFLLRLYYQHASVLFLVCCGNELFFMMWYMSSWPAMMTSFGTAITIVKWVSFPICVFKQILNLVQLAGASVDLVNADVKTRKMK